MMIDIYLSAPMRGIGDRNEPLFAGYAKEFRDLGCSVNSPPEISGAMPGDSTINQILAKELDIICRSADAVVVLSSDWKKSYGCHAEVATALAVGKQVWQVIPHHGWLRIHYISIIDEWTYAAADIEKRPQHQRRIHDTREMLEAVLKSKRPDTP